MKTKIQKFLPGIFCILSLFIFSSVTAYAEENTDSKIADLEKKYDVQIVKANGYSLMDDSTLNDLESKLKAGQHAREENQKCYDEYIDQLEKSGRIDNSTADENTNFRAGLSRTYFHNVGSLVPNGTTIRCNMTGRTMLDGYGNTLWSSLDSHSSRLSSGYGTDWRETDFSYNRLDGGRTYSCSYTGTLEEPYMSAGVVQYYVYSEGWRIWFEAYSS